MFNAYFLCLIVMMYLHFRNDPLRELVYGIAESVETQLKDMFDKGKEELKELEGLRLFKMIHEAMNRNNPIIVDDHDQLVTPKMDVDGRNQADGNAALHARDTIANTKKEEHEHAEIPQMEAQFQEADLIDGAIEQMQGEYQEQQQQPIEADAIPPRNDQASSGITEEALVHQEPATLPMKRGRKRREDADCEGSRAESLRLKRNTIVDSESAVRTRARPFCCN
ncbi:hypothetical protein PMAYCL1PPCAC_26608, partial [Pristionchus mayeri]